MTKLQWAAFEQVGGELGGELCVGTVGSYVEIGPPHPSLPFYLLCYHMRREQGWCPLGVRGGGYVGDAVAMGCWLEQCVEHSDVSFFGPAARTHACVMANLVACGMWDVCTCAMFAWFALP